MGIYEEARGPAPSTSTPSAAFSEARGSVANETSLWHCVQLFMHSEQYASLDQETMSVPRDPAEQKGPTSTLKALQQHL